MHERVPPIHEDREQAGDRLAAATRLARLAARRDAPHELLAAATRETDRPFGLVGPGPEFLGWAPANDLGRQAVAIASMAARGAGAPPAGWSVLSLAGGAERPSYLAIGPAAHCGNDQAPLLELVCTLLAAQLQRAALRAEARNAQRAALARRLVCDEHLDLGAARREAAEAGLRLSARYRPALVVWAAADPDPAAVRAAQRDAVRLAPDCLALHLRSRVLMLLHPGEHEPADGYARWLEHVVARARAAGADAAVHALAGRRQLAPADLRSGVDDLLVLRRFLDTTAGDALVVGAERFGLERLLRHGLDARAAAAFVEAQLGELIAWDAEHGGDLLEVLEAALDLPRQDQAARRCFMHRNTFRQRLRQAAELVHEPFEDPERRLALHVALKLRRLLAPVAGHAGAPGERPNGKGARRPIDPSLSRAGVTRAPG